MILHSVTHYRDTNTLEVTWLEDVKDDAGQVIGRRPVRCHSYSSDQRAEFVADTGLPEYADLAGWA